jgi:hypothetical protein
MSLNVVLCHLTSHYVTKCRKNVSLWIILTETAINYGKIVTKRHPTSDFKLLLAYCISRRPSIRLLIWMVNCYTLAVLGKIF